MIQETTINEIRNRWRDLYPADKKDGIICPLCGSGSKKNGSGITEDPKKPGNLKCWACDFSGDVIDLIREERHFNFNETVEYAANELMLPIDSFKSSINREKDKMNIESHPEEKTLKTQFKASKNDFEEYYKKCCSKIQTPEAISYLSARGISLETAQTYGLGFDPKWKSPTAINRGKNPSVTPRLIIPTSPSHYIARDTRFNISEKEKQYAKMNEGSPSLFNGEILFEKNLDVIFVTEGVFDALSLIEIGENALALNSTSNVEKFIENVKEAQTKSILILCLDNDKAGQKATQIIKDKLTLLNISYITADICGEYKDPNDFFIANKEKFIEQVQITKSKDLRPDNVNSYIDSLMCGEIERFKEAKKRKTGFKNIDEKTGGLYSGLYVIAAISSLGKTTFSLQIADNLAAAGNDVIFFSMEQSRLELVSKSLARITAQIDRDLAVSSLHIRQGLYFGNTSDIIQNAIKEYQQKIGKRLSIIEGNYNCSISFIGDYVRQYINRTGVKPIVFIDYLQILKGESDKRHSLKESIDSNVTELKRLSRELDLTIFVISSVNRANYLTPIDFESLKESGGIEFTADVIWGLQLQCLNDSLFDNPQTKIKEKREKIREEKAQNPRRIELLCLKNRYGISSFSCYFNYDPKHDLFEVNENNLTTCYKKI